MYRTLLVPLDGSDFGEQALGVASAIARRLGARVRLARVFIPDAFGDLLPGFRPDSERRVSERDELDRLAAELNATGVPTEAALLDGPVAETLTDYAAFVRADLVVLSTRGQGARVDATLGGVASELLRRVAAPLLFVRADAGPAGPGRVRSPRRLLVALDGSAVAETRLGPAMRLGATLGARFILARIVDPISSGPAFSGSASSGAARSAESTPACRDAEGTRRAVYLARKYLERVAAPWIATGLEVDVKVVASGDPARAILETAREYGCDLFAVESRRTGDACETIDACEARDARGFARLMLGDAPAPFVGSAATLVAPEVVPATIVVAAAGGSSAARP